MIRLFALIVVPLLLSACASAEGPGSLATVSPAAQQAQTAPLPGAVSAQTLAAPGGQPGAPLSLGTGQANAETTTAGTQSLEPGSVSVAPTQAEPATLQDFAVAEPGRTADDDPFSAPPSPPQPNAETTSQETLEQAIQAGLQPQTAAPQLPPATPQWPRVALAPISTAPEPQATRLFDAIDDAAYRRGLQLAFFGDETAEFVVRSQVSAIPADDETSVIYVFDIFDARGTLRHRVSGSWTIPRSGPDGWALVDATTTLLIADDVASRLLAWLQENPS